MKSSKGRVVLSQIKDFIVCNRKSVISFCVVFVVGIIVGILIAINACGGEFERIARVDMTFGAIKVFFLSSLFLLLGYAVILFAAYATKLSFCAVITFLFLGGYFGKYMCLLVACYELVGLINLFFVYIPFFLISFVCLLVSAVCAISTVGCDGGCEGGCKGRIRPSAIVLLKAYLINLGANFVVFIIIGSMTKVIVVGL